MCAGNVLIVHRATTWATPSHFRLGYYGDQQGAFKFLGIALNGADQSERYAGAAALGTTLRKGSKGVSPMHCRMSCFNLVMRAVNARSLQIYQQKWS